jgi:hypothetical protein
MRFNGDEQTAGDTSPQQTATVVRSSSSNDRLKAQGDALRHVRLAQNVHIGMHGLSPQRPPGAGHPLHRGRAAARR